LAVIDEQQRAIEEEDQLVTAELAHLKTLKVQPSAMKDSLRAIEKAPETKSED